MFCVQMKLLVNDLIDSVRRRWRRRRWLHAQISFVNSFSDNSHTCYSCIVALISGIYIHTLYRQTPAHDGYYGKWQTRNEGKPKCAHACRKKKYTTICITSILILCVVQLHDDYVMHFCVRYHRAQWQMIHVWPEMFEFIRDYLFVI